MKECNTAQEYLDYIFEELLGEDGSNLDWCNNATFNKIMTKKLLDK